MDYKKLGSKYILRIDRGEELIAFVTTFCKEQSIKVGTIMGLGAADRVTVGLFNVSEKQYYKQEFNGDFEITNLTGNISTKDGEVYIHAHITITDVKYNAYGGHLNECWISGTGELVIDVIEGTVERKFNEEVGLNLYEF